MSVNSDGRNDQQRDQLQADAVGLAKTSPPGGLPDRLGDYQIHERIGQGGMGAVYRATHVRLKRTVALKVLVPHLLEDSAALTRFRREIEAVGNLPPHRNVVLATDARQIDDTHFLVMEFVDGCDAGEVVRRNGPLAIEDACEIVRQAAVGLEHIAASGLVHRDLKPTNLLVARDGVVKILDLGLARFSTFDRAVGELTQFGQCLGTPDYMAPEQWEDSASVGIAADLYSLGCTLFFLLAGRVPFGDPSHNTVFKKRDAHLRDLPPDLKELRTGISRDLVEIVNQLLSKSVSERIATPRLLAQALTPLAGRSDLRSLTALGGDPSRAVPALTETQTINSLPTASDLGSQDDASAIRTGKSRWRQHRTRITAGFSAVVCLAIAVGGLLALNREKRVESVMTAPHEVANEPSQSLPAMPEASVLETPLTESEESEFNATAPQEVKLLEAQLWVRRDGDDGRINSYPLVTKGQQSSLPDLKPLTIGDDFNLRVEFSDPIWWRLIWLDTSGRVTVAASAEKPSAVVWYPGSESMMSIDPVDPSGQHLLLLVRDDQRESVNDSEITRVLKPLVPPSTWAGEMLADSTRGPGQTRKTLALRKHEYLLQVKDRLPTSSQIELPLFLPAMKESRAEKPKR